MTLDEVAIVIDVKKRLKLWLCPECDSTRITETSVHVCHCRNCSDFIGDGWEMEYVAAIASVKGEEITSS